MENDHSTRRPVDEGTRHDQSSHHDHHDPHQRRHEPYHDPHSGYHGMPYPLPNALRSEPEAQKDLLEGTKVKTRDAIGLALALSGAIATGYVKLANMENQLVILKEENKAQEEQFKDMSEDVSVELKLISTTINSLERTYRAHDNTADRRFEDLEERVASLFYKARRSGRDDDK